MSDDFASMSFGPLAVIAAGGRNYAFPIYVKSDTTAASYISRFNLTESQYKSFEMLFSYTSGSVGYLDALCTQVNSDLTMYIVYKITNSATHEDYVLSKITWDSNGFNTITSNWNKSIRHATSQGYRVYHDAVIY